MLSVSRNQSPFDRNSVIVMETENVEESSTESIFSGEILVSRNQENKYHKREKSRYEVGQISPVFRIQISEKKK